MVFDNAASVNRALRKFFRLDGDESLEDIPALQNATQDMIHLTSVLREREEAGQATTLRQLHTCANLSQREALRAVRSLELAAIVTIEPDHADAFASLIQLTETARRRLRSRTCSS